MLSSIISSAADRAVPNLDLDANNEHRDDENYRPADWIDHSAVTPAPSAVGSPEADLSEQYDVPASTFIESERLWFRAPEPEDAFWIAKLRNDRRVRIWLNGSFPIALERVHEHLETLNPYERAQANNHSALIFGIKGTSEIVGLSALFAIDWLSRSAEFGIQISPDHWSKGYGREVAGRTLQYAFEELNLHRVALRALSNNQRGIRSYAAAGFVHEGTIRQCAFVEGAWGDDVVMAALRDEWSLTAHVKGRDVSIAPASTAQECPDEREPVIAVQEIPRLPSRRQPTPMDAAPVPNLVFMESERLWYRAPAAADVARLVSIRNDHRVRRTMWPRFPISTNAARTWANAQNPSERGVANTHSTYFFGPHGTTVSIGNAGLFAIDWRCRSAEFGISIDPLHWNQGYGQEVTRQTLRYAFEELNLNRVQLQVVSGNLRGVQAYRAAGFVHEVRHRQAAFVEGSWQDIFTMSVLRDDWSSRQS